MKSVLISIQPKWCELIASGKKTIEVRKTRPKKETPFKCYIYETKGKSKLLEVMKDGAPLYGDTYHGEPVFIKGSSVGSGKVIGEFVCDEIKVYHAMSILACLCEVNGGEVQERLQYQNGTCLSYEEMAQYSKGQDLYGWHISALKIYDKPKEFYQFLTPSGTGGVWGNHYLSRPPQSWCYVEG